MLLNLDDETDYPPLPPSSVVLDLRQTAAEAATLLDLFSRSDGEITDLQKGLVETALKGILGITKGFRLRAVRRGEEIEMLDVGSEDVRVDAMCNVCYTEIPNTVFDPCGHLALCEVCF